MAQKTTANDDTAAGLAFAVSAYLLWGILPFYMKALAHIPAAEIVAHRILWSVPVAGAVLWATGRTGDLATALRSPNTLAMAALTAALISVNWGIYVWSIAAGHALDAALGYYINPLFSVFLGAVLLAERPSRAQMLAIALAVAAVLVLIAESGRVPWAALGLTFTWGFYAYFKKSLPVGPNQGFLLEVLLLSLPSAGYLLVLAGKGQSHFLDAGGWNAWMLAGTGIVTAVPLMLYANGAKLLRLSTIGMLQYIAPTMIFLAAVLVFGETFGRAERIAFPLIWIALLIYSVALLRRRDGVLKPTRP